MSEVESWHAHTVGHADIEVGDRCLQLYLDLRMKLQLGAWEAALTKVRTAACAIGDPTGESLFLATFRGTPTANAEG